MCNCGNKREQYGVGQNFNASNNQPIEPLKNKMWADVYFEYTGLSGLSVTGNITEKKYRFAHANSIQKVDYRDAAGMMAIPVLRKVNKPQGP